MAIVQMLLPHLSDVQDPQNVIRKMEDYNHPDSLLVTWIGKATK